DEQRQSSGLFVKPLSRLDTAFAKLLCEHDFHGLALRVFGAYNRVQNLYGGRRLNATRRFAVGRFDARNRCGTVVSCLLIFGSEWQCEALQKPRAVICNHGVGGSNPSAGTNKIKDLQQTDSAN